MGEIYRVKNNSNFFKQVRFSKDAHELSKNIEGFELPELLKSSPVALNVPASVLKERNLSPKSFAVGECISKSDDPSCFQAIKPEVVREKKENLFSEPNKKNLVDIIDSKPAAETQQEKLSHRVIGGENSIKPQEVKSTHAPKGAEVLVLDTNLDLNDSEKEDLDFDSVKSFEDYQEEKRGEVKNEERRELPRTHARGVGHPQPAKMKFGAFITLCLLATFPLSILLLGSVLFGAPIWVLAGLGVAAFFFFFYLTVASSCRCRVCGQGQFAVKRCRRHKKAHHVSGLGYIIPTSLHMLLFSWFRCIYCGTAINLKKDK